jgi:Methyltransferase domain
MALHHLSPKRRLIWAAYPLRSLDKVVQVLKWCKFVKSCACPVFRTRCELYQHLENTVLCGANMDYLEFGVAAGVSLKAWLELHRKPNSRFWGFDSFEGLPEDWYNDRPKGTFACGGNPPQIADPRLEFVVGLFQETLPRFLTRFRPKARLVIHNDSDLYSATLYTLTQLDPFAMAGTVIIFDEFWDAGHEFRALMDYAVAYRRKFSVIAATQRFGQAAVVLE